MGISTNLGYAVGIAGVVLACAVGPAFAAADAPAAVSAYPAATTRPVTSSATKATGSATPASRVAVTSPTPTGRDGCGPGMTATYVTSPAPTVGKPATTSGKHAPDPGVTTLPDGRTVRRTCVVAPPSPMVGPIIAPEHVVGGPALARTGVVTDLPAGVPSPPDLPHVSYVLADMQTGQIIAAKSAHALLYPASTLKTLTALVALPKLDPKRVITADPQDVAADGTRVGMVAGNRYTIDDLFNGLIMVSGNDTAYAIARAYGGRDRIIADMNAAAGRLGAWDTNAVDPSGLDADGQHTSAYDLALIGRAVMQLSEFRRHAVLLQAQFPGAVDATGKTVPPFAIANHNPIIETYPGTIGIKSGYTTLARNTFIGAATRGERTLIVAAMGSVERQAPSVEALLTWGFAYAGQARPVGQLVAPGTATEPPEWRGASVTAPPSSADLLPSSDVDEPPASSAVAVAAESPLRSNDGVMAWWEAASDPARWTVAGGAGGVVAAFALLGVALGRRRARGAHQR